MKSQPKTTENRNKWPVCGQSPKKPKLSRTSAAYWKTKVYKAESRKGTASPDYSVRISFQGRRERFPLHTPNKDMAASKAVSIFKDIISLGWEDTIEKYKPNSLPSTPPEGASTVGDLIKANMTYSTVREGTLYTYIRAMRKVVCGTLKLADWETTRKAGLLNLEEWKQMVDSVELERLTPTEIQKWKQRYLSEHKSTKQSITTINSLVRNAKSLFATKLLPFISEEISLPSPLPFDGVLMEKQPSYRYHSKIDAKRILARADSNLSTEDPEAYKILLLSLVCGLRISEVDYLLWTAFDFENSVLRVRDNQYKRLKSEDSSGDLHLSDDMVEIFQQFFESSDGEFVIQSNGAIKRSEGCRAYRCKTEIARLIKWLRSMGVTSRKPIHELRKEIGSIIATDDGIFAASRYLRHSDIRITSSIYADQKKKIIPSLKIK